MREKEALGTHNAQERCDVMVYCTTLPDGVASMSSLFAIWAGDFGSSGDCALCQIQRRMNIGALRTCQCRGHISRQGDHVCRNGNLERTLAVT